ncbi:hypothetical protein [Chryseobacterium kwangjuense]|uniref:Lipoprotein n=1 Tax=Chryseobacterium kwangjuense TaxID=267125 RepID=A0A135WLB5_9FLAO|nr:hypothetical protein [Chryseobacterium kwangjuense]KXH85673.1 hypothetical protein AU378_07980 [Chryseobacterium kwangjuense]
MKTILFIVVSCLFCFGLSSCKPYNEDSATLIETNKYVVYTSKENIKRIFQKWLKSQKHDKSVLNEDTQLYNGLIKKEHHKPWNIYKIADSMKNLNRLQFHTAFLLETNQAFVYNKILHRQEKIIIEKSDSYRKFKVNDTIILHVIDRFY